jgi:hypothetical protein
MNGAGVSLVKRFFKRYRNGVQFLTALTVLGPQNLSKRRQAGDGLAKLLLFLGKNDFFTRLVVVQNLRKHQQTFADVTLAGRPTINFGQQAVKANSRQLPGARAGHNEVIANRRNRGVV